MPYGFSAKTEHYANTYSVLSMFLLGTKGCLTGYLVRHKSFRTKKIFMSHSAEEIMFKKKDDQPYRKALDGVSFKSLAHGQKTHLTEFRLEKGSQIPVHSHPHEQTGYLVSGKMRFTIAGEAFDTEPGCAWSIPGLVEHGVEVLEDCLVIEVFSPAREDYL